MKCRGKRANAQNEATAGNAGTTECGDARAGGLAANFVGDRVGDEIRADQVEFAEPDFRRVHARERGLTLSGRRSLRGDQRSGEEAKGNDQSHGQADRGHNSTPFYKGAQSDEAHLGSPTGLGTAESTPDLRSDQRKNCAATPPASPAREPG